MQWNFEYGPTSESVTFLNRKPTAVVLCFANTFLRVLKKTERKWLVPELPLGLPLVNRNWLEARQETQTRLYWGPYCSRRE